MAHDHCCVNYCTNDKRNESGQNLSFFNFPKNSSQRSKWIAAIKRDEGTLFQIKKGSTLVCSAHFKPSDMFKTITGLIRLKPGVVPSQFQWTKSSQDRPQNKLQELKTMAEQQEQEERRQSFVDSFQQDVKMEEGETASGGQGASASDEQMEEMATDEPENENIEPAELSAVEQIEILKAQISDLEQQVEDLKGTRFGAENISKDSDYDQTKVGIAGDRLTSKIQY